MNPQFKYWLEQQDYAWNPIPRKRGWIIWSVNKDIISNSEHLSHITSHKWRWTYMDYFGKKILAKA
jgi:hypothetical protein